MAAPLVLKVYTDTTQSLKSLGVLNSAMAGTGKSALGMGEDIARSARIAVLNSVKVENTIAAEAAAYRQLATDVTLSARAQANATRMAEAADTRLARAQGLVVTSSRGVSTGSKTAERDLGKLTRGALAGSGVISALGRSLAFASGGFIAVAGTATLLHNAITEALSFAATEKQVTAQLKTSVRGEQDQDPGFAHRRVEAVRVHPWRSAPVVRLSRPCQRRRRPVVEAERHRCRRCARPAHRSVVRLDCAREGARRILHCTATAWDHRPQDGSRHGCDRVRRQEVRGAG